MKLFAVIDLKAKALVATFTSQNEEAATRSFVSLLSDATKSIFTDFPEDFALYPVADLTYDLGGLCVMAQNSEAIKEAGFNVQHFYVREPITDGISLGKDYLKFIRLSRIEAEKVSVGKEDSTHE